MLKKPRVLIVDDEVFVLRALRRILVRHGFEVFAASTPVEALCIVEDVKIDVVICDENMPGTSGVDFLIWVREHHPRVSRILLSGFIDRDVLWRCEHQADVFEAFDKPWRNASLIPTIWSAVAYAQLDETAA